MKQIKFRAVNFRVQSFTQPKPDPHICFVYNGSCFSPRKIVLEEMLKRGKFYLPSLIKSLHKLGIGRYCSGYIAGQCEDWKKSEYPLHCCSSKQRIIKKLRSLLLAMEL